MSFIQDGVLGPVRLAGRSRRARNTLDRAASDGHGGTLITFTSAMSTTGGHGNAIATPGTS